MRSKFRQRLRWTDYLAVVRRQAGLFGEAVGFARRYPWNKRKRRLSGMKAKQSRRLPALRDA